MAKQTNETKFAIISKDLDYIKSDVADIKNDIQGHFVTKEEFEPVKKITFGLVTLVLTAVVIALIGLVIIK
jgi:hypothetical protein